MKKLIPYGRQNIDQDDIEAVAEALQDRLITQGPRVGEFEEKVAAHCGARYGVAFNSGTSALHASMYVAGIGPGDEVITSPITFAASANAAVYVGAKPVFADMDMNTYCIDIAKIEAAITPNTKAIVPVDYAGYPVDIRKIKEIADKHDLLIIEDAAHALGSRREGIHVGQEADMTMFSFHPVKHITTGEGGMIVTNSKKIYQRLKQFRSHGMINEDDLLIDHHGPWYYEMQDLGYNFRITDIQCALGISQLKKLDSFVAIRNQIAGYYEEAFKNTEWIDTPPCGRAKDLHAYHLYPILLNSQIDRKEFFKYMRNHNIWVQVHYIPVHVHPYYRKQFNYQYGDYPAAEDFYSREVSLPIYPGLSEAEQQYVIETVKSYINKI